MGQRTQERCERRELYINYNRNDKKEPSTKMTFKVIVHNMLETTFYTFTSSFLRRVSREKSKILRGGFIICN